MLDTCAPGYRAVPRTHHYCIYYNDETYPTFPKGKQSQVNPEIQKRHVRKMARWLDILDCAEEQLPAIK